ncbi:hypothetical protein AJ78_01448 [Emergomyces pasteurianus Ep9510]|uniref:Kinetochore protein Mis14 n=1 Tax=Emergomyces pasteurianus Ep9510 TaxID=1447872 RepID=A0A1J9QRL9_9EURO|nr:hypothetical protein AJ78_01448 [Emergomyces pasteurianus Ep9510]
METPHHRKIELQSPADLSYLYANTVALSRQKLDLHFPPSANPSSNTNLNNASNTTRDHVSNPNSDSDPMKSHVRDLVDEFIHRTFLAACSSISINGLSPADATSSGDNTDTDPLSFLHIREAVEYEPYDTALAARVAGLYAQLESLTTTVAQLRRDAPGKAAGAYAEALREGLKEDDGEWTEGEGEGEGDGADVDMKDVNGGDGLTTQLQRCTRRWNYNNKEDYTLHVPFGNAEGVKRRWLEGGVGDVYTEALRTLVRLQGEMSGDSDVHGGDNSDDAHDEDGGGNGDGGQRGLATTVGKVERARRAAEVVENL